MTTPFPFQVGATLLSSQLNAITELVVNDKTASHTLTAADAGDRVIMNSASATTITVDTSVFTAGQVIYVTNKGVGVCTITAGTATVSTTGTLALSQFASGVLYCISAGVFLFEGYDRAPAASGLVVVKSETAFTAVSSFTADSVFTSTFTNYLIQIRYSSGGGNVHFKLRAAAVDTSADYNSQTVLFNSGTTSPVRSTSQTSADFAAHNSSGVPALVNLELTGPQLAVATTYLASNSFSQGATAPFLFHSGGNQNSATAFDGIKILSTTSTLTGTFTIYGYGKTV